MGGDWVFFERDQITTIHMWDPASSCMIAQPQAIQTLPDASNDIWNSLANFNFGTPNLLAMPHDSILLTYYATLAAITHIRACLFQVRI